MKHIPVFGVTREKPFISKRQIITYISCLGYEQNVRKEKPHDWPGTGLDKALELLVSRQSILFLTLGSLAILEPAL